MGKFKLLKPEEAAKKALKKVNVFKLGKAREDGLVARKKMGEDERAKIDSKLFDASEKGDTEEIKRLIKSGADVNFKSSEYYGMTPLMVACMFASTTAIGTLLFFKANVDAKDEHGWTALMHAAICDGKGGEMVKMLLSIKAEIEAKNKYGETALLVALRRGGTDSVKSLLEGGANVNAQDGKGKTPLMNALPCEENVCLVLSGNPDLEMRDNDGKTALRLAIDSGQRTVAMMLIEKGADPEAGDKDGWTPAHSAIWKEDWMVLPLIHKRYEPNPEEVFLKNAEGLLHLCSGCGRSEPVEILMSLMHDYKGGKPLLEVDCFNKYGKTPLMEASSEGSLEVARLLLKEGAKLELRDTKYGMTPLHWASWQGHEEIVAALLDAGAEIDAKDKRDETPIIKAISGGREKVVDLLIKKSANLQLRDRYGNAVIELGLRAKPEIAGLFNEHAKNASASAAADEEAAQSVAEDVQENGGEEDPPEKWYHAVLSALKGIWEETIYPIIDAFKSWGQDLDSKPAKEGFADSTVEDEKKGLMGDNTLAPAVETANAEIIPISKKVLGNLLLENSGGRRKKIVGELLKAGADVDSMDAEGVTALMEAAWKGDVEVAEMLIDTGADLDVKDNNGCTALWLASREGHRKVVELLIDKGADLDSRTVYGSTSLMAATRHGHTEIAELLREHGAAE